MSYTLTINADLSQIERLKELLAHIPNAYARAAKKAASETLRELKKTAGAEASKVYEISAPKVRKNIKLYPSSGTLIATGKRKNLADYRISPKHIRNPQRGIKGSVMRSSGMRKYPRGFLIHGRNSGKLLAFQRTGSGRKDIEPLIRPAIPQLLQNEQVSSALTSQAEKSVLEKLRIHANKAIMEGR